MRALICDDYGGIDALRVGDLPEPEPKSGELLVDVASVTVNFADTLMVTGEYQVKPDTPFAPGYELAGTVLVANNSPGFSPGDRVCGMTWSGAMAEMAALPARNCAVIPDGLDFDAAATLPAGYGTSFHSLVDRARLAPGETLLVLGAAGGVGMAAVQIGKALGATVLAAVSSDLKAEAVATAGADMVLRYDSEPLRKAVDQETGGEGVDVVFDPVGGEMTEQALRATRWNGRYLVIGFANGEIPKIPLNLPLLKGNSIVGVFWGRFTNEEPDRARSNLDQILAWACDGTISPMLHGRFSLDEGRDALRMVAGRQAIGRLVVNP